MANFKSENQGTWFFYNPKKEKDGGVCLRELSTDEHTRIEKITTRKRKKFKGGQPYDDVQVDEELASKLRWDYCIVDWSKTELDGQELECNSDNKVKMMKVIDFVKFVVNNLDTLVDSNKSLEEARVKNFGPSSSGDRASQTVNRV
jgi:hypothetical protein